MFFPDNILPPFLGVRHGALLKHQLYQEIRQVLRQLGTDKNTLSTNLLPLTREQQPQLHAASARNLAMKKAFVEWNRIRISSRSSSRPYFWDQSNLAPETLRVSHRASGGRTASAETGGYEK